MNNTIGTFFICTLLQLLLCFNCREAFSRQDSLFLGNIQAEQENRHNPHPGKAALYSAVLPGMGQVYNRKYWKVPIIYGGFAGLAWYTLYTNDEFVRYRNALTFRDDGNPETTDEFAGDLRYTDEVLTRFKDFYRRQRDRTVIWTALFYALNIIDATVDAHFFEFDVSDDLGMRVSPSFSSPEQLPFSRPGVQAGVGISFSLNF